MINSFETQEDFVSFIFSLGHWAIDNKKKNIPIGSYHGEDDRFKEFEILEGL